MQTQSTVKRVGAALVAAASLVVLSASTASANWSSYISSWTDGD